jgi:ABC-2 type transport system ATP-binding protein
VVVVEGRDLVRTYLSRSGLKRTQTSVEAVKGVSFEIAAGELFGLLGPNGAGKTTIIKMLTTLLLPTSGVARVLGYDVATKPQEVRKQVGYVFGGDRGLYDRLTGIENLRYFADLYRVAPSVRESRIAELLELVGLAGRERERVERYSRGMKQRLHIARGLLHDPPVVFLDEPTIGLDPVGARELRLLIRNLVDAGKTLLLTTHYMFEADELCDRIAVIDHGRIVAEGTPDELKRAVGGYSVIEIEAFGVDDETLARLRGVPGAVAVAVEQQEQAQVLVVQAARDADVLRPLLRELETVRVGRVATREPTLEDAYVQLVSAT